MGFNSGFKWLKKHTVVANSAVPLSARLEFEILCLFAFCSYF